MVILICLCSGKLEAQEPTLYCEMHMEMDDFLRGKAPSKISLGVVASQSERHVLFEKFKDPETGKKDKKAKYVWALMLDSVPYLNLVFSTTLYQKMAFLQLDLVGRYCAASVNEGEKWLAWRSESLMSSGIIGKGIAESGGVNFIDTLGVQHRILIVDTEEIYTEQFSGNQGGMGVYLTFSQLNEIVVKTPGLVFEADVYQLSFEEVMALLSKLNMCYREKKTP